MQEQLDAELEYPAILRLPLAKQPGEPPAHPLLQSKWVIARDACQRVLPWPSIEPLDAVSRLELRLLMEDPQVVLVLLAFVRGE